MEKKRCRHERNSWVFAKQDYAIMWCYKCGAIREMARIDGDLTPFGKWQKPVGPDGTNPAIKD